MSKEYVYVLNADGTPLMPTQRYGHVRRMLKNKEAVVVKRTPFTIRMREMTGSEVQPVSLGADAGHDHIALSAVSHDKELYAAEYALRKDVKYLMEERKEHRRSRNKKKRYRAKRVENRASSKNKGWIATSSTVKIQEQVSAIRRVTQLLPVTLITLEIAEFDFHALNGTGTELIDERLLMFNRKQYFLWSNWYKCQSCKGKEKDPVLILVDEKPKVSNVIVCKHCYSRYVNGKKKLPEKGNYLFPSNEEWFGNVRAYLYKKVVSEFPDIPVSQFYGYITKSIRENAGISKSYLNDARVMAGGKNAEFLDTTYFYKPLRRHNRKLHKTNILPGGIRKKNQTAYFQNGFVLWEKVMYNGRECFISGRRKSGYFCLKTLSGETVHTAAYYKKLKHLEYPCGVVVEKRKKGNTLFDERYPFIPAPEPVSEEERKGNFLDLFARSMN